MNIGRVGTILLGIWLVISGLAVIINLTFQGFLILMAILAIAAGVCLLIGAVPLHRQ